MAIYGQVVIGPPGSGKTTFCNGMQQYLRLLNRNCYVVNLDPANEFLATSPQSQSKENDEGLLPYDMIYDICQEVIHLNSVMEQLQLGPNGGLLYCMEYIEKHSNEIMNQLQSRIQELSSSSSSNGNNIYLLFDLPGQVELYTHCSCIQSIFETLVKKLDLRLCLVQLLDSHFCLANPERYIGGVLYCMSSMIRLELPTVNILSKIDLLKNQKEEFGMNIDFYLDCQDMTQLLPLLFSDSTSLLQEQENDYYYADDAEYVNIKEKKHSKKFYKKYQKMHEVLCEVINDFSLVSFLTCDINDASSVGRILSRIDKANGFVFLNDERIGELESMFHCAVQNDYDDNSWKFDLISDVQERNISRNDEDKNKE